MSTFGPENACCHVYTFKEGLLSSAAHDLKLSVEKFSVEISADSGTVTGSFDATSLRVACAMKNGLEAGGVLSPKDHRDIEAIIIKDVINVKVHPLIKFTAKLNNERNGREIVGSLSLNGRERMIICQVTKREGMTVTECSLHQPDFGIKPFSAMFGTLKIKPDIKVVVTLSF